MTRAALFLIGAMLAAVAIELHGISRALEHINTRAAFESDSLRRYGAEGWARADIWRTLDSTAIENRARDILRQRADRAKRRKQGR
jgi:hypothetical protein